MAAKYTIYRSDKFDRAFDKLTEAEQDLVLDKIDQIEEEGPYYPSVKK